MKYVRTYESFVNSKDDLVLEGILGNLFKSLKDKISLKYSKMFGSAAKVDQLMKSYKEEAMNAFSKKKEALTLIGKFEKAKIDGEGEEDKGKLLELIKSLKVISNQYNKERELIKKKFEIKFSDATKDDKNVKVKNYINIKKIEMEQEIIQMETYALLNDTGLTEDDIKGNKEIIDILKGISDRSKKMEGLKTQEVKTIASEPTDAANDADKNEYEVFDFEEAKKKQTTKTVKNDKDENEIKADNTYETPNSKYVKDYKFEADDEIRYLKDDGFANDDNYKGTTASVISDKNDGKIEVKTDGNGFLISKSKIISTKKDDEAANSKPENNDKKAANPLLADNTQKPQNGQEKIN